MQVAAADTIRKFDAWLEGPASFVGEAVRALNPGKRLTLKLAPDGRSAEIVQLQGSRETALSVPVAAPASGADDADNAGAARLAALARDCAVSVMVPAGWIIERRIELPLEAAGHVDGVVANRLAALSPLPPPDTLSGHRVLDVDRASGRMTVAVAILPKARIRPVLDLVAGAETREVGVQAPLGEGVVTLMPGRAGRAGRHAASKRLLAGLIVLAAVAAVAALAARPLLGGSLEDRRAGLERRADAARATIAEATSPATASTMPEEAALQMKNDAVSALGALDDLAAALPLHAYATEIVLADGLLRVAGRTSDLPDVLTALESSGRFAGSRLIGTAQLSADGVSSDFVVETRPLIRTGGGVR